MPRFLLVRHGAHDFLGRILVGRRPGVQLNGEGHRQAEALAERLAEAGAVALYCGPLERSRQTAEPLARRLGLAIHVEPALDEVDFGNWTGRSFEELGPDPLWRRYNRERALTRIPGGEMMAEVAARMTGLCHRLACAYADPASQVLLVGHGDPMRALIAQSIGLPLDSMLRFELDPGSLSILAVEDGRARLLLLNDRSHCR
jgi:probable phosphoglycerate mutase